MKRSSGSILFRLTWKAQATPSGRLFYLLRASEARTADIELASWPTPTTPSGGQSVPPGTTVSGRRPDGSKATVTLEMAARAAAWPTPTLTDSRGGRNRTSGRSNPDSKHHDGVTLVDAAKRCTCGSGRPATLLCDWKVEGGTCDARLCEACTHVPAPDKDLCPKHASEWKARRR